jgi:hypothetical protein
VLIHTQVIYHEEDDTFAFHSDLRRSLDLKFAFFATLRVKHLSNEFRVQRNGDLVATRTDLEAVVEAGSHMPFAGALPEGEKFSLRARVQGTVRDGTFVARGWVDSPFTKQQDFTLEPVPVSGGAAVLNPLHPVNRLVNVRPGQSWRMPLVDPLADAVRQTLPKGAGFLNTQPTYLNAEVLHERKTLTWQKQEVTCLVIEYRGDHDFTARTWVRESDGLVLRQEATQGGETLTLEREFGP